MNKLYFGTILKIALLLFGVSANAMQTGLNVLFNNQSKNRSIVYAPQANQKRAVNPTIVEAFKKNQEYYSAVLKAHIPQQNPFIDETFAKATDPDAVTLEFDSQRRIIIPKDVARECQTIRNLIDDCETNSIPLVNQPFLTRDILKKLFLCIKDKSKCSTIPTNDLQNVLLAANFLNCQKKISLKEVGFIAHIKLSEEQLLPETKNFINHLFEPQITNNNIIKDTLRIGTGNLINLDALEKIPEETRKKITKIDGAYNYLKELDFDRLRELFPNLQKVDFQHNLLNKINGKNPLYITCPDNTNIGFQVDLSHNNLQYVPTQLLMAANLNFYLNHNSLPAKTCDALKNIKAPFIQKYSQAIKLSFTVNKWEFMKIALSGIFFGFPIKSILTQPPTFSSNYITDRLTNAAFAVIGAACGGANIQGVYEHFINPIPQAIKKNPFITTAHQKQPPLQPITMKKNSNFMILKSNGLRDIRTNNL